MGRGVKRPPLVGRQLCPGGQIGSSGSPEALRLCRKCPAAATGGYAVDDGSGGFTVRSEYCVVDAPLDSFFARAGRAPDQRDQLGHLLLTPQYRHHSIAKQLRYDLSARHPDWLVGWWEPAFQFRDTTAMTDSSLTVTAPDRSGQIQTHLYNFEWDAGTHWRQGAQWMPDRETHRSVTAALALQHDSAIWGFASALCIHLTPLDVAGDWPGDLQMLSDQPSAWSRGMSPPPPQELEWYTSTHIRKRSRRNCAWQSCSVKVTLTSGWKYTTGLSSCSSLVSILHERARCTLLLDHVNFLVLVRM